ncbi:MAG: class I SAM-dependent methyltransferase [Alphaproteobacteria bacterium]
MKDDAFEEVTAKTQTAKIFEWRQGFDAIFLISLGVQLGLFRAFAEGPGATSREIAARLGLHLPFLEIWCTTAYSLELLEVDADSRFRLAPFWESILADPTHPRYLGSLIRLLTEFATEDFRRYLDGFRSGRTVPFQGRSDNFARLVAEATAGLNFLMVRKVLPAMAGLVDRLNRGGMILDVGCGSGGLLIQLAGAFPESRCVGIDIDPTGLAAARATIARAGISHQVEILEGDIESIGPADSFDAVLMVEVLHEVAPVRRLGLLQGCARMLRPGGWLVILDETYPSTFHEAREPEYRLALQTGFEELICGNIIPTREEQERLLRDAGFMGEIGRQLIGEGLTLLATQRGEIA